VQRYLLWIDRLSMWTGKAAAWLVVIMTLTTSYDVLARKFFGAPTGWAYETQYMMYASIFMLCGAYALSRNQMVRGDMFYRLWPVRRQAAVDLLLYFLFFVPGILALVSSGAQYAALSWEQGERTQQSAIQLPLYPLKTIIPIAGTLLLIQGIAEIVRCVQALRTGVWPSRLSDVEETETVLAKAEQL